MNFHSSRYASTYGIFNLDVVNVYEIAIDYKIQFYPGPLIQNCTRGIYHQSEDATLRAKQLQS